VLDQLRRRSLIAVVRPYHGLGNRMRTVLSAQSLAEEEQRHFAYCWPVGSGFGARLDDLWQFPFPEVSTATTRVLALRYPFRDATTEWRTAARGQRVWQIRTSQPVALPPGAIPWPERLRRLPPTQEIAGRIRDFFTEHLAGRPYVGVMIRAHHVSHAQSREHSPVEWFVARMREIRAAAPDVAFFVSCDVPEVQERVAQLLGDTFGQQDKGPYNSGAAVKSAVVDLYLLASSMHLIGPHYSSFPELALHLAGDRLALETSLTPPESAWERRPIAMVADPLRPAGGVDA